MKIEKIHIIGLANVLKPLIMFRMLESMNSQILCDKQIEYLTESDTGMVSDYCKSHGIPVIVINHEDIMQSADEVRSRNADLLICIGWDKLLPVEFMNIYGKCINIHGGLLPDYRGNRAYMSLYANIPDEYGVTCHYMTPKFDDGKIISQCSMKFFLDETPEIIHRRLAEMSAYILPESVRLVEQEYEGTKQTGSARYFTGITRSEMDALRQRNIDNLRHGKEKELAPHRQWEL